MLAGIGEFLELEPELLDDLRTAISEACNNVVLHAYDGDPGPLIVSLEINADGFQVVVRDCGGGIQRVAAGEDRMGVGLAVISALADRAEFESHPDGGTAVRMSFGRGGVQLLEPAVGTSVLAAPAVEISGDIVAVVSPIGLGSEVLGRLIRAVAASEHFSIDRFSDLYPVTDAISQFADRHAAGSSLIFAIVGHPRRIELTVGPFAAGTADALTTLSGDNALVALVDDLEARPGTDGELLLAAIVDKRPTAA
jgi:anti-sigma regulatory factor (Ser/Thr protein kinase)